MIREFRDLAPESLSGFDACIIGSGPAGISVALELAGSGARICILEAGGEGYEEASQALCEGDVLGDSYPHLRETRFAALGGATQLWAGWCRPLDPIDFERRSWVPESGWPLDFAELEPHYRRAHELCRLSEFEYDPAYWEKRLGTHRIPLTEPDLATSIFQVSPVQFGYEYRARIADLADVEVFLHAPVLRFQLDPSGQRVASATVAARDGRSIAVQAKVFVLATGGIENARLLLLSGDSPERSIGNAHGLVGRYFTEHAFIHPGTFVSNDRARSMDFYFPTRVGPGGTAAVRGTFSLDRGALEREGLLNCAIFFRSAYEAHSAFETPEVRALLAAWEGVRGRGDPGQTGAYLRRAARNPGAVATATWRRLSVRGHRHFRWPLRAFFESEPRADNRVQLSDASGSRDAFGRPLPAVRWTIAEADLRSIRAGFHTLDVALRKAGVGHLELAFPDELDSWRAASEGGKHHMGTTRMHASPGRGVVDASSRVHGIPNLYVAGSSVFPTVGFANPTLTIVALSVRLGRHLRSVLGNHVS